MQNSLTSPSRPLPLPDIGWDPIICTCSSPMSFHPFYPFIPADYLTLPASPLSHTLPALPATPPAPSPGYYVWPLSTLILRIYSIYLFPLPLPTPPRRLSHPPPIEPAISCMATSTRKARLLASKRIKPDAPQQASISTTTAGTKSWMICNQVQCRRNFQDKKDFIINIIINMTIIINVGAQLVLSR